MRSLLIVALAAIPRIATAQGKLEMDVALKARGDAALEERRYTDAIGLYQLAFAADPNPAILYSLGRAHQYLGDFPKALELYERFEQQAPPDLLAKVRDFSGLKREIRSKVARVVVRCRGEEEQCPTGTLLQGDRVVARTPTSNAVPIVGGRVTLVLEAPGFHPAKHFLDLPGDARIVELPPFSLVPKATSSGTLEIRSEVPRTRVFIDDRLLGTTPLQGPIGTTIEYGKHRIRVEKDGYEPQSTTVVVDDATKAFTLSPGSTPITKRWWFWTLTAGVVLAGAGFTVYALTHERSGDTGTIAPGVTSAPLRFLISPESDR